MNKSKNHIQYGLATGGAFILLQIIVMLGNFQNFGNISVAIVAAIIFLGVFLSCKNLQKKIPEADNRAIFFNGLRTTALAALMVVLFGVVVLKFFPSFKTKQIEKYSTESKKYLDEFHAKMRKDSIEYYKADTTKLATIKIKLDSIVKEDNINQEKYIKNYDDNFVKIFVMFNLLNIVMAGLIASLLSSYLLKKR